MKKFRVIAIMLAAVMVMLVGFTACNKKESGGDDKVIKPEIAEGTKGEALWNVFVDTMKENENTTPEDMANKLSTNEVIEFMPMVMPVEEGWLAGFPTEELKGFKSGAMYGPMIGSIPFVGYIFELADDADVNSFISMLKEKSDPRWNICVEADTTLAGAYGNKVFFLMYPENDAE